MGLRTQVRAADRMATITYKGARMAKQFDIEEETTIPATPRALLRLRAEKALELVRVVSETIRELGSIPSGHLYAMLMPHGMDIQTYDALIDLLKRSELVVEKYHELHWVGDKP